MSTTDGSVWPDEPVPAGVSSMPHAETEDETVKLRAELDTLVDQLEAALGLHHRPRRFVDQAERARTAVRKAIKRAIDELDSADPVVGHLLRSSITTGSTCVHAPDPDTPVRWSVSV